MLGLLLRLDMLLLRIVAIGCVEELQLIDRVPEIAVVEE